MAHRDRQMSTAGARSRSTFRREYLLAHTDTPPLCMCPDGNTAQSPQLGHLPDCSCPQPAMPSPLQAGLAGPTQLATDPMIPTSNFFFRQTAAGPPTARRLQKRCLDPSRQRGCTQPHYDTTAQAQIWQARTCRPGRQWRRRRAGGQSGPPSRPPRQLQSAHRHLLDETWKQGSNRRTHRTRWQCHGESSSPADHAAHWPAVAARTHHGRCPRPNRHRLLGEQTPLLSASRGSHSHGAERGGMGRAAAAQA